MSPTGHGGSAGDDLVVTDVADVADVNVRRSTTTP